MDVKGAKALSERLAEAARNVDPPHAKAVVSKRGESPPSPRRRSTRRRPVGDAERGSVTE